MEHSTQVRQRGQKYKITIGVLPGDPKEVKTEGSIVGLMLVWEQVDNAQLHLDRTMQFLCLIIPVHIA